MYAGATIVVVLVIVLALVPVFGNRERPVNERLFLLGGAVLLPLITLAALVSKSFGCQVLAGRRSSLRWRRRWYSVHCAGCHGTRGEGGGNGPSLVQASRTDLASIVAFVKNPAAPMPKLHPSPLNDQAVQSVSE
jgi:hypothetical protein